MRLATDLAMVISRKGFEQDMKALQPRSSSMIMARVDSASASECVLPRRDKISTPLYVIVLAKQVAGHSQSVRERCK
jgi:hypothetical protein